MYYAIKGECRKKNFMNMRQFFISVIFFFFLLPVQAKEAGGQRHLTAHELERVTMIRENLGGVDKKTLQQMVGELENRPYLEVNLQIKEAMAKAYVDIVREQNVMSQSKKEWLYSMIALNMAYLQFAADKDSAAGAKNLNKLIRYKLKQYLPQDIFTKPGFHCSLG